MSLTSVVYNEIVKNPNYIANQAMYWVMKNMDYQKFGQRVVQAHTCPTEVTKCVLLEFNFTHWETVEAGVPDVSDRLPGTDEYMYNAFNSEGFHRLARTLLTDNNPKVQVYTRQRINSNGVPDLHKYQLVLMFEAGAYTENYISQEEC